MSVHDKHEPRCGVCVLCEFSIMRARISAASRSSSSMFKVFAFDAYAGRAARNPLWFVLIIVRLSLEFFEIGLDPCNAFIEAAIERYFVLPAQFFPHLLAFKHVGGVLTQSLADNLHAVF